MPTLPLTHPLCIATRRPLVTALGVALLAGCAATSDNMGSFLTSSAEAFATVDGRILRGQARLSAEREGTLALQSIDGGVSLSCFGPLRYTATAQGVIGLQCSNGRSASIAFQTISPLTGTGRGTMDRPDASAAPADFLVTYGVAADNAAAYLAVPRDRLTPPVPAAGTGTRAEANAGGNTL